MVTGQRAVKLLRRLAYSPMAGKISVGDLVGRPYEE
jgi:hypothetical protein